MTLTMINLLPSEILDFIAKHDSLTWQDCISLCYVCKRFSILFTSANQELWKLKFQKAWPKLYQNVYVELEVENSKDIVWKSELESRFIYGKRTKYELEKLSAKHYYDREMSASSFKPFIDLHKEIYHERGQYFQIDVLEDILNDGKPTGNLTIKYYCSKVIRFLRHEQLKDFWKAYLPTLFVSKHVPESTNVQGFTTKYVCGDLIRGTLLLSSWFQPHITIREKAIRRQLELIALLTVDEVKSIYPNHSLIVSRQGACLTDVEAFQLCESLYCEKECKEILICLNNVLFFQLNFKGNKTNYYAPDNSFMDKILNTRTGIPITMSMLYQALASKLGVRTHLVNFPRHIMLKWLEFPDASSVQEQYSYIDVFEGGKLLKYNQLPLPFLNLPLFEEITAVTEPSILFQRMCNNLVEIGRQQESSGDGLFYLRNGLELSIVVKPNDIETKMLLARVYAHLNINLERAKEMLYEINAQDPAASGIASFLLQSLDSHVYEKGKVEKKIEIKRRSDFPNVQFAVGMMMKHKKYKYWCIVFGWDPICSASRDWILQMGVQRLPNREKQPFYNVLVEDGSTRYAAQENLEIAEHPHWISHGEVGKYFKSFTGRYYEPNEEKNLEYPEDLTFLQKSLEEKP